MPIELPTRESLGARPIPQGRTPIVRQQTGQVARATQQLGAKVRKIAQEHEQRRTKFEATKASSFILQESSNIQQELAADNDYSTHLKRYDDHMERVMNEAGEMIQSPAEKQNFLEQARMKMISQRESVSAGARRKEIDVGAAEVDNIIETNSDSYLKATNEEQRSMVIKQSNSMIDAAVANQYIDAKTGASKKRDMASNLAVRRISMLPASEQIDQLSPQGRSDDGTPIFTKTGTYVDFIAPDERMKLYGAAVDIADKQAEEVNDRNELVHQARVNDFLGDVLPTISETGSISKLTPVQLVRSEELGLAAEVRNYDGTDKGSMLSVLYDLSPDELSDFDLDSPVVQLSLSQDTWKKWKEKQGKTRTDSTVGSLDQNRTDIVKQSWRSMGLADWMNEDKDDKAYIAGANNYARFNQILDVEIDAFRKENNGKTPNRGQLQEMVDNLLVKGGYGKAESVGLFGVRKAGDAPTEQIFPHEVKIEDIPHDEISEIEFELRRQGYPVTNSMIIRTYIADKNLIERQLQEGREE